MSWKAPLLGRRVDLMDECVVWDEPARRWWRPRRYHLESYVVHTGEVVDRADGQAEYLIACEDGKLRWWWSDDLRIHQEETSA